MKKIEIELFKHPFEAFIPNNATKILIGTIPPNRFCSDADILKDSDVNFYYGSSDNGLWKIIGEICNIEFKYENTTEAINHRKDILTQYNIAVVDIINEFTRCGDSSLDSAICVQSFIDVYGILKNNKSIRTVFFTSGEAEKYFRKHLNQQKIYFKSTDNKKIKIFSIDDREIQTYTLYSPSNMTKLAGITSEQKEQDYEYLLGTKRTK